MIIEHWRKKGRKTNWGSSRPFHSQFGIERPFSSKMSAGKKDPSFAVLYHFPVSWKRL